MDTTNAANAAYVGNQLRQERIRRKWRQHDLAEQLGTTAVTVKRWERGRQQPSLYFRVQLCTLFGKSAEELGFIPDEQSATSASPEETAIWSVPFSRNPFFTGRDVILDHLHNMLTGKPTIAALTQSYALHGLGGVGKTQLAIEYAYRHRSAYEAVMWVEAETQTTLSSSMVRLATVLALPEKTEEDQSKIVAAVLRWLDRHEGWLLIFDNVEDLSLVKPFLPTSNQGALLITTRLQTLNTLAQRVEIPPMDKPEGCSFLLARTRHLREGEKPKTIDPQELAVAQAIVTEMGGLPLALEQAGAYIDSTQCSLSDYLRLFQQIQHRLLNEHEPSSDHSLSVSQTFALAFEQVEQRNPLASALLTACAFLAPEAIPETIFQEGASSLGPAFEVIASNPLAFSEAIKVLLSYSLLQRNATTHSLTIHRLVQVVLKGLLSEDEQRAWKQRVFKTIHLLFPTDEQMQPNYLSAGEQLITHAQICLAPGHQWNNNEAGQISLMNQVAIYLSIRGRYDEAEPLFTRAIQLGEQMLGTDHSLVADSLHGLANLWKEQGKYNEAITLFERALHIRQRALRMQHPLIGSSLDMSGDCYYQLGQLEQAEASFLKALQMTEQLFGTEHLYVASPCIGLGKLYITQGKYEQAKTLYQRALRIRERALGPEHPQVSPSLNNLGMLFAAQGKYEQAEPLLQRALQIVELALGPEHPRIAFSLNNLGVLNFKQGKYKQATLLFQRALHVREQVLGPEHPDLAHPLNNLGGIYAEQEKYEQAEALFRRSLHILELSLGPENFNVALPLGNLGELCKLQGKYEQAEHYYQRTLSILEQSLGPEHPDLSPPLNNLGELYKERGAFGQAEAYYQRALSILEQNLGPEHPDISNLLNGLGNLFREQGKYEQAGLLYHRALQLRQQHLHPKHPLIAETLHELAHLHQLQQQTMEALSCYQLALVIREQELGPEHQKTKETRAMFTQLSQEMNIREPLAIEPETPTFCACGCGREVDRRKSRGEPKRFFSRACKQRFYRNVLRHKRNTK